MSITSLSNLTSQSGALSIINGTGTSTTQSASSVLSQSQDDNQSSVSKFGQNMSQLKQLATSDPSKFKSVSQNISKQLAEAAKNTTDAQQSKFLSSMSDKFAEAAKTGSMSSLEPSKNGQKPAMSSAGNALAGKYGSQSSSSMSSMFSQIGSIVSSALSSAGSSTSSSSTSSATSITETGSISGSDATAA